MTYSYDPDFGVLDHVDRGLGTTWGINPQNRVPLLAVSAAHWDRDSVAKMTDPRNYPSNYVFDRLGWVEKLTTPDGEKQRWFRDPGEQVAFFFDQLQRPTGYQHDGSGDLLKVQYPDRALRSFVYAGPFHHLSSFIDVNKYETQYSYNGAGDRTLTIDALDYPTIYSWDAALLREVTNARGFPTYFTHDAQRRLILTLDAFLRPTHFTYDAAGYLSLTTDALSHATQTHYDERGRLTATTDALTNTTAWDFNAVGQVTRTTDAFPRVTEYEYDQRAWQTKQIEAAHTSDLARTTLHAYDAAGNLTSTIARRAYDNGGGLEGAEDPATREDAYAYDVVNRRTQMTEAVNDATAKRLTNYGYDPVGNLLWVDRPRDYETPLAAPTIAGPKHVRTSYGYDARDRQTLVLEAVGTDLQRSTKTKYDREGHVVLIADPLDRWTVYDYDALYRRTRQVEAANQTPSRSTWYDFDPVGNLTEVQDALERLTKYIYDPVDRLITMTEAVGTDVQRTTSYANDVVGNLIGEHRPRFHDNETIPVGEYRTILTSYAYDALNRLTKTEEAANVPVGIWNPQPDGRVITLLPHARPITEIAYDEVGHVTLVTDPLGRKTRYDYDALDRRTATVEDWQGGTNESERRTAWTFDAADNLRSETHGLGTAREHWSTISYAYDVHNRRTLTIEAANAQSDLLALGHVPPQTFVIYDAADNAVRTTDPRGTQFDSVYDVLHRLDTHIDAVNHPTTLTRRTLYDYDLADRLIALSTPQKYDHEGALFLTTSYAYDELDRQTLTSEGEATGLHRSTQRAYDILDNLTLSTDALGVDTRFAYDKLDRLTRVTEAANHEEQKRVSLKKYDAADNLIAELRPRQYGERGWNSTAEQATTTSYLYDALNRPASVIAAANQTEAALGHLPPATQTRYDIGGRVLLVLQPPREAVLEASTWSLSTSYSYDRLDRQTLIEEGAYVFGAPEPFTLYRWAYRHFDAADNLAQETTGLAPLTGPYPANPATTKYDFDALNRLVKRAEASGTAIERWTEFGYEIGGEVVLETRSPKYEGLLSQDAYLATKRQTAYDYDALGRRTQVTEAWAPPLFQARNQELLGHPSPVTSTEFNAADRVTRAINPRGVATDYAYDALNRRTRIEEGAVRPANIRLDAGSSVTMLDHDLLDRLTSTRDPQQTLTAYDYDVLGRQTSVREAVGQDERRRTNRQFDAADNLVREDRGIETSGQARNPQRDLHTGYQYDALNRLRQTREADHIPDENYPTLYPQHPRPITFRDYDAQGNLTRVQTPVATHDFRYDRFNRQTQVLEGNNEPANRRVTAQTFDASGNRLSTWDGSNVRILYIYDILNRLIRVIQRNDLPADDLRTTLTVDAFDQVTAQATALGTTNTDYDRLGRLRRITQANASWTSFTYDAASNRLQVQNSYKYRLASTNQLLTHTDTTEFVYDALNHQIEAQDPSQLSATFTLDKLGRVVEVWDRNHQQSGAGDPYARGSSRRRNLTYDRLGRLTDELWYEATQPLEGPLQVVLAGERHYIFDSVDNLIASYLGSNEVASCDQTLRHDRTFDDFNRISSDQGAFSGALAYEYDAGHRRTAVSDAFGGRVESTYDVANRLTQRRWTGSGVVGQSVAFTYESDPTISGKLDRVQTVGFHSGATPEEGNLFLSTTYGYDALARTTRVKHLKGAVVLEDVTTVYQEGANDTDTGLVKRETRASERLGNGYAPSLLWSQMSYAYDPIGQVMAATYNGSETTFPIDDNGNPPVLAAPPDGNRVPRVGAWVLTYDGEGNVTRMTWMPTSGQTGATTEWRYGYDHANRLVSVVEGTIDIGQGESSWQPGISRTLRYDAEGRLVETTNASNSAEAVERYAYNGSQVWAELTSSGSLKARYLHGDRTDQLLARQGTSYSPTATVWYLADRQNSILQIVSGSSGLTVKAITYKDGKVTFREGLASPMTEALFGDRYEYTGREWFEGLKLQHNRARWLDPATGRWMSEDPLGFAAGDVNLYRYVGNSHPNATDPEGLWALVDDAIALGVGALVGVGAQLITDLIFEGQLSDWQTYVGAAVGGAVAGEVLLYTANPMLAGAAAGLVGELTTQGLYKATKDNYQVDWEKVAVAGVAGAVGGKIGGAILGKLGAGARPTVSRLFASALAGGAGGGATAGGYYGTKEGLAEGLSRGESGANLFWTVMASGGPGASKGALRGAAGGAIGFGFGGLAFKGATGLSSRLGHKFNPQGGILRTAKVAKWVERVGHGNGWLRQPARLAGKALDLPACFPAGVCLLVPGGLKAVEEFREGDLILSRSEWDPEGPVEVKRVQAVFVRTGRISHLHIAGRVLRTTPEHPYYAEERGWVQANELKVGDRVWTHERRWLVVEEVYDTGEYEAVYNLKVSEYHTYFVGSEEWGFSVWAHNSNDCINNPTGTHKFKDAATNMEVDIPSIKVRIPVKRTGLSAAQITEVEAKYAKANQLLHSQEEVAAVHPKAPNKYKQHLSRKYLAETYPDDYVAVPRNRVAPPTGKEVDEAVGRIWGGRQVKTNQHLADQTVNEMLGPTEQGVRNRLIKDGHQGKRIAGFVLEWVD